MTGPKAEKRKSAVEYSRSCLMGVEGLRQSWVLLAAWGTSPSLAFPIQVLDKLLWSEAKCLCFPLLGEVSKGKGSACLLF